jgi:phosphoglycolate phosphatase
MRYRLAIFDFDGTLCDSFPWFMGAVNVAADRFGFRRIEPHDVETLRGWEARQIAAHLGMPMWKMPFIARHMRRAMAGETGALSLFPGVEWMLRELADAGVALAMVTSNSEANVRRVLGEQNAALFRHYGCGASILGKRPKLRQVLRASGIRPGEAICIGDEIRDLHAAHAEGIAFGAVTWGFASADALRQHAPEEMFGSVDEIVERLTSGEDQPRAVRSA